MYTQRDSDEAEEVLAKIAREKNKMIAMLESGLGYIVPASNFEKDLGYICEAYDDLVFGVVKEANRVISEVEKKARLKHEKNEQTY